MNDTLLAALLDAIPGDDIGGVDLSFSDEFDAIRNARRQDDPSLAQGDWQMELKIAQWPKVVELAEDILRNKSKDLQVAAWYAEALTKLRGFEGLAFGLTVLDGLICDFWEFCYPSYDPEDTEERIGKIEWINQQLPMSVRNIPLTDHSSGGYSWHRWEESRAIDNLGLKDTVARDKAIASGKLSGEAFDKAVQTSGREFYEKLHRLIGDAKAAVLSLESHIDQHFGHNAPSLKDLRLAILSCHDLVGKLLTRMGGHLHAIPQGAATNSADKTLTDVSLAATATVPLFTPTVGVIYSRSDAVKALREVSLYFKMNEPHSPVYFLVERAASWAEMPLDQWLASVIKDDNTLGQLQELLGVRPQ
jgi:type VI secretion system protein ImpA